MKNNKAIRIVVYTFACMAFFVLVNLTFDGEYPLSRLYRDLLLAFLIAANTVYLLPVVVKLLNKNKR